jgi:hypothetical protein
MVLGLCAHCLSFALMKRWNVYSHQRSVDPSVALFKLEVRDTLPVSDPKSGLGRQGSLARRSKRVKVEIVDTEGTESCGWWRR